MNRILFCLPTLFNNPKKTVRCVQNLLNQCEKNDIEYKIFVVSNVEDELFSQWDPGIDEVEKIVSGLNYSISKALNVSINKYDSDYFVFLQDDMFIHDDNWIGNFIDLYENDLLNCGVIGTRPHTTSKIYCKPVNGDYPYRIDELLWSDGVMFFSTKLFGEVGIFDENYFGDCESQDFCYKVKDAGYKNYRIHMDQTHETSGFDGKVRENHHEFLQHVNRSREFFHDRWDEWQDKMVENS